MFRNIEIEKNKFYHHKSRVTLKNVDAEKVLVPSKISFGKKVYNYVIGYLYNDHKVRILHIMRPETSAYAKSYDGQITWMYFLIEYDDLLEKHNNIWDEVSVDIKKEFDTKSTVKNI